MKSDYISRSALSKKLTMLAMEGAKSHQRAYVKCINEVETAPNGQMWIDVTRALPGDDSTYLVWNGNRYDVATYWGDGEWIINGEAATDVTHWMPLPPAPEEEE